MSFRKRASSVVFMLVANLCQAQEIVLDGAVDGVGAFAFVPFEVPPGTLELEIRHDSTGSSVLDWGLIGPDGTTRGWGGGNGEDVIIGLDAATRSYLPGIEPGTWQVAIGKARLTEDPAAYTLSAILRQEATLARRTDRGAWADPGVLAPGGRWVAGDFHVHSLESGDARASFDEIADLARSRGLEFVVITDHNTNSTVDFLAAAQARHPDVLFIPGMELTTYAGHMNLFGTTAYHDHGLHPGWTLADTIDAVHAEGGLVSVNHPALDLGAACIGCAWDQLVDLPFDAVEVQTGGLEPVGGLFTDEALAFWAARGGVAMVGGSDDHRAGMDLGFTESPIGSPTTLVYVDELSIQGVLDGVRAHRTVVKLQGPEDPMVELTSAPEAVLATGEGGDELRILVEEAEVYREAISGSYSVEVALQARDLARAEVWEEGVRRTVTSSVRADASSTTDKIPKRCGCATPVGLSWLSRP